MPDYKSKSKDEIKSEVNESKLDINDIHSHIDDVIKDGTKVSDLYKIIRENITTKDGQTEINKTHYNVFKTTAEKHKEYETRVQQRRKGLGGLEKELYTRKINAEANAQKAGDILKYISIPESRDAIHRVKKISQDDAIFTSAHRKNVQVDRLESEKRSQEKIHELAQIIAMSLAYMSPVKPTVETEPPESRQLPSENEPPVQDAERQRYIPLVPEGYKINERVDYQKPQEYIRSWQDERTTEYEENKGSEGQ